ncbi:MAG: S1C family serine protease [Bacillota bacterium]
MAKKEYWKIPIDKEFERDLDTEMINEINNDYDCLEVDEEEDENEETNNSISIRLTGLITLVLFVFFAMGYMLKIDMPPFNLIVKSKELSADRHIQELQEAVVVVNAGKSQGTGFNINSQGLIITNYHIIDNGDMVFVKFKDGKIYKVQEKITYPEIDLAILKISGDDLPYVEFIKDKDYKQGEQVIIIGNPLGLHTIVNQAQILGETKLKDWQDNVIAIMGDIHKGNSGSPVFNKEGKVVAVIFATLSAQNQSGQERIVGLAVPADLIKNRVKKAGSP